MCVYSMIMDHYYDKWKWTPQPTTPPTIPSINIPTVINIPTITADEINEFRKLLERAREYDKKHNQPNCELEEKKAKLKRLAKELGVDIAFIDNEETSVSGSN